MNYEINIPEELREHAKFKSFDKALDNVTKLIRTESMYITDEDFNIVGIAIDMTGAVVANIRRLADLFITDDSVSDAQTDTYHVIKLLKDGADDYEKDIRIHHSCNFCGSVINTEKKPYVIKSGYHLCINCAAKIYINKLILTLIENEIVVTVEDGDNTILIESGCDNYRNNGLELMCISDNVRAYLTKMKDNIKEFLDKYDTGELNFDNTISDDKTNNYIYYIRWFNMFDIDFRYLPNNITDLRIITFDSLIIFIREVQTVLEEVLNHEGDASIYED